MRNLIATSQMQMGFYSSNFIRLLTLTKQLSSHVSHGHHDEALNLFCCMQASLGLPPLDPHVFSLVLKSCSAINRPQLGSSIHAHSTKSSFISSPFVASALVDMYGKCVSILLARKLFDEIPQRNVVVWNSMISIYARSNHLPDALRLFESMDVAPNEASFNSIISELASSDNGSKAIALYQKMTEVGAKANLITLLALLPACVGIAALNLIKEIHGYAVRNDLDTHPQLSTGLVEAYGRCGSLENAHSVFHRIKQRDVISWSSLISAYALHGKAKTALHLFHQMETEKVQPDEITFLGVLKACSHVGLADEALTYFMRMGKEYSVKPNSDHYSCMVDVLSRAGRLEEAYKLIREMPVKVTAKAWGALLGACRTYGDVGLGEVSAKALFEIEPENAANYVLLAKIYASVGRYEEAESVRRDMIERKVKAAPGSSWSVSMD